MDILPKKCTCGKLTDFDEFEILINDGYPPIEALKIMKSDKNCCINTYLYTGFNEERELNIKEIEQNYEK